MSPHSFLKNALAISFFLFVSTQIAFPQKKAGFTFGTVLPTDFDLPANKIIDSNASAVIIANVGSVEFVGNNNGWISYVYKRSARIKILKNKAYDAATTKIYLYGKNDEQDQIDNFHASTYNISNNKVIETKLVNSDILTEKLRKGVIEKKFTMPDVKEGSIIEYTYAITSFRYYDLPAWNFQSLKYPSLYSEYKIGIPDMVRYSIMHYGADSFSISKTEEGYKNLTVSGTSALNVGTVIHNHTWVMKDIPAFKNEDYVNHPTDYLNRIEFTLVQTSDGQKVHDYRTTWKVAEDQLLTSEHFGAIRN